MKTSRNLKPIRRDSGLRPPKVSPRAARRLTILLLWVATCVGAVYGVRQLEAYAAKSARDGSWEPQFPGVPETIPEWVRIEACESAGLGNGGALRKMDVNDPRLCEAIAAAVQKSAWVAKVQRVSKQADGLVKIYATFRTFLTFVLRDGKGYLVDEDGFRLPREENEARLGSYDMIILEGVQEAVPDYGEAWPGEATKNGLRLVKMLQRHCPPGAKAWLKAVDVSNYRDRKNRREGWLTIRTIHPRTRILWGHPPGEEYDTEPSAEQKLAYIQKAFSIYGQLPDGKIFDLRDRTDLQVLDAP